jgi:hypothetical protein
MPDNTRSYLRALPALGGNAPNSPPLLYQPIRWNTSKAGFSRLSLKV